MPPSSTAILMAVSYRKWISAAFSGGVIDEVIGIGDEPQSRRARADELMIVGPESPAYRKPGNLGGPAFAVPTTAGR